MQMLLLPLLCNWCYCWCRYHHDLLLMFFSVYALYSVWICSKSDWTSSSTGRTINPGDEPKGSRYRGFTNPVVVRRESIDRGTDSIQHCPAQCWNTYERTRQSKGQDCGAGERAGTFEWTNFSMWSSLLPLSPLYVLKYTSDKDPFRILIFYAFFPLFKVTNVRFLRRLNFAPLDIFSFYENFYGRIPVLSTRCLDFTVLRIRID